MRSKKNSFRKVKSYKRRVGSAGEHCVSLSALPAAHLRLISLCQIMSSESGRVLPSRTSASRFLRYDFAVRSESIGCDKHSLAHSFVVGPLPCHAAEPVSFCGRACYTRSKIGTASQTREGTHDGGVGGERASSRRLLRQRAIAPQVRRQCSTRRRTEEAIMSDL